MAALKKIRGLGRTMNYPGRLIIVEGCDGSGKSTQLHLLRVWLEHQGYPVFFTEWNSSDLVNEATRRAKKKNLLTPTTFSLIHACDFTDRYEKVILPPLRAGYIVLADRYVYTAYARDVARGCDADWVRNVYSFAVKPTLGLYFQAPLETSISRILVGRPVLKYHEAGMDLGFSADPVESFKIFQGIIKDQYDGMVKKDGLTVIDATRSIDEMQREVRSIVRTKLKDYVPPSHSVPVYALPSSDPDLSDLMGETGREAASRPLMPGEDLETGIRDDLPDESADDLATDGGPEMRDDFPLPARLAAGGG
jgi:dTMP kinase